jgi:DNA polymerase III delta subunit
MNFSEFKDQDNFDFKVYVLNGEEELYKVLAKEKIRDSFKTLEIDYVDSELEVSEFYSKIDSSDLFPHPKLFYINNTSNNLSKQKQFWSYVKSSDSESIYIINSLKEKVPTEIKSIEIKCDKIKDSQKDVCKAVGEIAQSLGIAISVTDLPIFYSLYKNNLFAIYQELKKCKTYLDSKKTSYLESKDIFKIVSPALEKDPFIFANNFMHRKLKSCIANLPNESDFIPQFGNIFNTAEKILVYKSAKLSKMSDDEICKKYEINPFYLKYNLLSVEKMWSVKELSELMIEIESINCKIRRFNFTVKEAILNLVFQYCK